MRGSEIGLQAVLLHSPLAFVVLDYNRASGKHSKPNVATGRLRTGMTEARMFLQLLTDFDSLFGEVHLVRKADEHSAFGREEGTGGFLALVVSEGVVVGEAEDFTSGAHFWAENRVHLRELVDREHCFLGAVVLELLVLELEVIELRAEHQAGCEAGLRRPFGLQPHSRLRRLVKTSRLRLTGVLQTLETRGTVRENSSLGVPAHTCAVGLYFMGCPVHSVPAQPHKTAPQCRPKGSLSLTRMLSTQIKPIMKRICKY